VGACLIVPTFENLNIALVVFLLFVLCILHWGAIQKVWTAFCIKVESLHGSIKDAFKDKHIAITFDMFTQCFTKNPETEPDDFINKYQGKDNTCFGLLFEKENNFKMYLAFSNSNDKSNKLGNDFANNSNKFYCQYDGRQLSQKLPFIILDHNFLPVESTELYDREQKHQTCAERKIIAKVLDQYKDTHLNNENNAQEEELCLTLFTKFAPCEHCQLLIEHLREKYYGKLKIKVLYINYLRSMNACSDEAADKELQKGINDLLTLIDKTSKYQNASKKKQPAKNSQAQEKKRNKQKKRLLSIIAHKQYSIMKQAGMNEESIRNTLMCLSINNKDLLTTDDIASIMRNAPIIPNP
jgi:hypothetical protein